MKFLIHGAGGVGGFLGAKLHSVGNEVWFLARGKHFEVGRANGLRVNTTQGSSSIPGHRVLGTTEGLTPVDVVLFCVKTYDIETAAKQLTPVLNNKTIIIPLQNGIESVERITAVVPTATVYGGVTRMSSRVTAPGEITETGGFHSLSFGLLDGTVTEREKEILSVLQQSGINADLKSDIVVDLWRKFIFITTMGAFTAVSRLTQGEIIESPAAISLVFSAMREVEAIARAKNVGVESLEFDNVVASMKRFDPNIRSSMYFDLMNEKPMEIESLNGTVVRLGKELGIPTPIHETIYAALLPHHVKHLGKLHRT